MKTPILLFTAFCICSSAFAAPGDLDITFGTGGKVVTDFGGNEQSQELARSVAVQSDGKIVVAGYSSDSEHFDFLVARYTASGALDPSFGTGGKVFTDFGPVDDATSVVVQGDGKIVVAGLSYSEASTFGLARYTTSGALDPSFGAGGKAVTPPNNGIEANSMAVQADGKIVVAGTKASQFAVVRFTASGLPDPSFGSGGTVITAISSSAQAVSLAVQSDGKIVVAGYSILIGGAGANYDITLVRYTASGVLDGSFGTGGKVITPVGDSGDFGDSVVLQNDGKIVVAGYSGNGARIEFALLRYMSNGALDPSFGAGGKVTTNFGNRNAQGHSVMLQGDGKIVVAGGVQATGEDASDFALARYTASGVLDSSFGMAGKITTDFGGTEDIGLGVALQIDGKIVAAGLSRSASVHGNDIALARYEGGDCSLGIDRRKGKE